MTREADMIDFRDDDSDPHVKQMIDFFEVVIERAVAAEREACAALVASWNTAMTDKLAAAIRARGTA